MGCIFSCAGSSKPWQAAEAPRSVLGTVPLPPVPMEKAFYHKHLVNSCQRSLSLPAPRLFAESQYGKTNIPRPCAHTSLGCRSAACRAGLPDGARARLWGGRGAEEHTPPLQRDCPFFPSPSQGHVPGAESGKVRPETQTSWASPSQRDLFPASPAVAKLSFDSPVTLAPSRVPGQTGSPSATAEPERELTCSGCN